MLATARGIARARDRSYRRAVMLAERGDYDRAISAIDSIREPKPLREALRFALRAEINWAAGDDAAGWEDFHRGGLAAMEAEIGNAQYWTGEQDITTRSICVHVVHTLGHGIPGPGLGDILQFARYLPMLVASGAEVYVFLPGARAALAPLLSSISPTIKFASDAIPATDFAAHLISLPHTLAQYRPGARPRTFPYLKHNEERAARWGERLGSDGFKIGVCWNASKTPHGAIRSFPLRELEVIARVPGVRLISLQKDTGPAERATLSSLETLDGFDEGPAFLDTAAVMSQLDLVISCDTSIAHVAGALARPTWLAGAVARPRLSGDNGERFIVDTRWVRQHDHAWHYPTVQLFAQPSPGDWASVFEEMACELREMESVSRRILRRS